MSDEKNAPSENVQALANSLLGAGKIDPRNNSLKAVSVEPTNPSNLDIIRADKKNTHSMKMADSRDDLSQKKGGDAGYKRGTQ